MSENMMAIILMGLVTFGLRYSFFGPLSTNILPDDVESALPYIMPAALMAIIVPDVILTDTPSIADVPYLTPYLIGAFTGFAVGAFRRNNFWTIVLSALGAFVIANYVEGAIV